jgi:hypothetical protein
MNTDLILFFFVADFIVVCFKWKDIKNFEKLGFIGKQALVSFVFSLILFAFLLILSLISPTSK